MIDVSPWAICNLGGGRPDDSTIWHSSGWSCVFRLVWEDGFARDWAIPEVDFSPYMEAP